MIWYVVAADEQRKPISIYLPDGPATRRLEAIVRYPFGCNVFIIAQVS